MYKETSKVICERAIKKLYTKEYKNAFIDAINEKPAEAIPLVLKRLKQKEEEWSHLQVKYPLKLI